MKTPYLTLQNLSKYYTSGQSVVMALNNINLTFRAGEFVALTGESGSGKSTLSKVIAGILPYESGEMSLSGLPTSHYGSDDWEQYRCQSVSYISQSYDILPGSTVMDNVLTALRLTGMDQSEAASRGEEALRQVELWNLRNRRAAKLSSGQKQRLSIARALAKPAKILIADEPTGNLDKENSSKVIQLLAQAARERLVIMVTHDFEEAAGEATRRIVLRDGVVISDQELRPAHQIKSNSPSHLPAAKKGLDRYTGKLQIRSHPMWSALMLGFFALTVFAVFAFVGTFIVALDDTSTYLYDNSAFVNGNDRRIVVCNADGTELTSGDEAILLEIPYVESLERYSYLADTQYAWREDVDYSFDYSLVQVGGLDGYREQISSVSLKSSKMAFAKTVPVYADGRTFLSSGRLPENMYEVVAAKDDSLLGQTIPVFLQDTKNWAQSAYLYLEVTVVGITEEGSGLYFHDDMGKVFHSNAHLATQGYNMYIYVPSLQLTGMEARMEDTYYQYLTTKNGSSPKLYAVDLDTMKPYCEEQLDVIGSHLSTANRLLEVSYEMFPELTYSGGSDQFTLMLEDYAYTDRVLEELYELGYAALSPYREGSVIPSETLAEQRMQTLRICLIALLVIVVLLVVVLRAMFGLQTEDWRLLRNIGLDGKTAGGATAWQIIIFAVSGQILGLSLIHLCGYLGIASIAKLLRYLPLSYRVILSLIHLAVSAVGALWVIRYQKKQVFPDTGYAADINWSVFDKEVDA